MAISRASAWLAGSGSSRSYDPNRGAYTGTIYKAPAPEPIQTSPATPPEIAGLQPQAVAAQLYGHNIPIFVGGRMLIGGRICEGPWFGGTLTDPTVSFIAYHALNIGNDGGAAGLTQTVATQARLHAQEVWNSSAGYIATDKLPVGKFDWRGGHYAQNPFTQSVLRFGANALAYTDGIITSWQDIPLKPFGGYVPMPSVLVENSRYGDPADGIPRTEALNRIFEYMRLETFEYEVDVSGSEPAVMIAAQMELEEFLKQLRSLHVNWEISYKDKIRIVEPTAGFTVSAALTNRNVLRNSIKFNRTDPLLVPRETRYKYIDVDRDYEFNVAVAREDLQPIPTTFATNSRSIELPVATTAASAVADVYVSHFEEQAARFGMEARLNATLFGTEPGDGVSYLEGVHDFVGLSMQAAHDFADFSVGIMAVDKVRCDADVDIDPFFSDTILLLRGGGANGSTVFTDESFLAMGNATVHGNAQITTSTKKFGTGSIDFDGTGDQIDFTDIQHGGGFIYGTVLFTIEMWLHPDTWGSGGSSVRFLICQWETAGNNGWVLYANGSTPEWAVSENGTTTLTDLVSSTALGTGAWQHLAVTFDGTTYRMFIDGAIVATSTTIRTIFDSTFDVALGANSGQSAFFYDGKMHVRVSRDRCRYTTAFTPPAAFPEFGP